MIKLISKDTVYVTGAKNGAIYNFKNKHVYSIKYEGTKIINKYLLDPQKLSDEENKFISIVKEKVSIPEINNIDYNFVKNNGKQLKFAWLEVTQRCNMRCVHCYEGKEHFETDNAISFEKWISILDELSEVGCKNIQFIGGEPTLYSKLPELLDYAHQIGFKSIVIFSNLSNLSEKLLKSIVNSGCKIRFSIYGSNALIHESVTQIKGSFDKLVKNLKILIENHVKVSPATIIMKENETDKENIPKFLKSISSSFGTESERFDEIRKVYGGNQEKHMVKNPTCVKNHPGFIANKSYFDNSVNKNTCWHGKFAISTNGDVYPCEFERSIVYGNVNKQSVKEILNSPILNKCWGMSFKHINFCKDCEYRFACKDCRPLGYADRGILTDKSYRCSYNPYTGKWI